MRSLLNNIRVDSSATSSPHPTASLRLISCRFSMAQAVIGRVNGLVQKASQTLKPAYSFAEKHAVENFNATLEKNKQYVVKDQAQADKLFKQWFFTKMAR